jgi:hypothetical protein
MPRDDDWDDDDDRPRRRRDRYGEEDDDYDRGRSRRRYAGERSGAVTAIAVISFVMGGLVLLFGICALIGLLAVTGEMGRVGGGGMMALPGFGGGIVFAYIIVLAILLWGIGAIFAGVGIVNRAQWGRVLCLVLAGFAAVVGVLYLIGAISIISAPRIGGPGFNDGRGLGFMISLFIGLLFLGYCVWSFAVLLNSRYGAEFR